MNNKLYTCLTTALLFSTTFCSIAKERIPFRLEGNLLLIKATINGQTGDFILDTGAPELILNDAYFKGMRIPWDQKQIVDLNGYASETSHFAVKSFSIGDLPIKEKYALSVDLTSVEKLKGIHLLGIIGYSVLKNLELLFDFDRQELTFAPSSKKTTSIAPAEPPLATFDLRLSGHIPYLIAQLGKKKLRLGIDTGAEVNIINQRTFKHASGNFHKIKKLQVKGISQNQKTATSGVLHNLYIDGQAAGPLNFTVISFHSLNESLTIGLDGLLGIPFLKKGRVGMDLRRKKLWVWGRDGRLVDKSLEENIKVSLER